MVTRRQLFASCSLPLVAVTASCSSSNGATGGPYYVSGSSGSDARGDGTRAEPWATLEPVNDLTLGPGTTVSLEGGHTYDGPLEVAHARGGDDLATPEEPITFTSYGDDRATINVAAGPAFDGQNLRGVRIEDLHFAGPGPEAADSSGIRLVADEPVSGSQSPSHVVIDRVEVDGFADGIFVAGDDAHGYQELRIRRVEAHDNGNGIVILGDTHGTHQDVRIERCHVHHNPGRTDSESHTGNGILVNGVTDGLVEHCVAHDNGDPGWGNIGIWCYGAKRVVIQLCESYDNRSSTAQDGGGFDIDGGAVDCVIQYCYSHGNDGAGYLWAQYEGASDQYGPIEGCVMRYNISENDARANAYGAMTFWGATEADYIDESVAYNNTLYMDGTPDGPQAAVGILNDNLRNVTLRNNLLVTAGDAVAIRDEEGASADEIRFQNNGYHTTDEPAIEWSGSAFDSVDAWLEEHSEQERVDGDRSETVGDPRLAEPGGGGRIFDGVIRYFDVTSLAAYELTDDSPMIDAGLDPDAQFDTEYEAPSAHERASVDFRGTPVPHGEGYDIGACEYRGREG